MVLGGVKTGFELVADSVRVFSIFRGGAPSLKERGFPTGQKREVSRPGRKPT